MRGYESSRGRSYSADMKDVSQEVARYVERTLGQKIREYDRLAEIFKKLNQDAVIKSDLEMILEIDRAFRLEPISTAPSADDYNLLLEQVRQLKNILIGIATRMDNVSRR